MCSIQFSIHCIVYSVVYGVLCFRHESAVYNAVTESKLRASEAGQDVGLMGVKLMAGVSAGG